MILSLKEAIKHSLTNTTNFFGARIQQASARV